jgi:flagellar biosynthesis protein FliP
MPPNQVLVGLALFLTLFVMNPVITELNDKAYKPYTENTITQQQALDNAQVVIKTFMIKQTSKKDLGLFVSLSGVKTKIEEDKIVELPLTTIVPAFLISELTTAFKMGFLIYIPFLVIDMVVASTLMSMGMMMLPPVMISLPFKILLFIMVGGWNLLSQSIVQSFVT